MGFVALVGAGPGAPELLTLRAVELLKQADVVLYDHLAPVEALHHAPASAERIYVGKKRSDHTLSQAEINRVVVERAQAGARVVRLKGGDPFVFGRGGEEAQALAEAGVPFEVVPGVTSALGAAAYAGIPLTHRDFSRACTFLTGHEPEEIDWSRYAGSDTLVLFMAVMSFGAIGERLVAAGRPADTPAAAIRWATRGDQQIVGATIGTLVTEMEAHALRPPALIVVGDVVGLHEELGWYARQPLYGQTVVVTRAPEQAAGLSGRLRALGARTVELPVIRMQPPADRTPLGGAIAALETYDWLLFTSANGVRYFVEALDEAGRDLRAVRGKLAAIGPATAEALAALHLRVDVMPAEFVAESVIAALSSEDLAGKRILLPRAKVAREVLPDALRERGAHVDVVPAYETVVQPDLCEQARQVLEHDRPDWITFLSSSTVRGLVDAVGVEALRGVSIASIGPITSQTARDAGLAVDLEAAAFTGEGLVQALVAEVTRSNR